MLALMLGHREDGGSGGADGAGTGFSKGGSFSSAIRSGFPMAEPIFAQCVEQFLPRRVDRLPRLDEGGEPGGLHAGIGRQKADLGRTLGVIGVVGV